MNSIVDSIVEASLATIGVYLIYALWGIVPAFLFGFWGIVFLLRMVIKNQFAIARGIENILNGG